MHPAPVADVEAIVALRHDLTSYTLHNVAELVGPTATAALHRDQRVPARRALAKPLADGNPLAGIVSCFMLADPIDRDLADTMFPMLGLDGALALNIVTMNSDDEVIATVDLSAYATDRPGNLWVASDQTALQLGAPIPAEHILGIGEASLTLASLTPRDRVEAGLDIGTGCGVQAMHLLTHADHVTITDISARALDFAVFNILLNAPALDVDPHNLAERVTVAQGNMLEPVAGQRFELIVTNPPFVIAPVSASVKHTYREAGRTGDQLVKELISTVDTVLTDGGVAVMLANWEMYGDQNQSWHSRLETWPAKSMDIWAIQRSSSDPAQYAEMWLQDSSEHLDPNGYDAAYANYLTDFETRGVTQIGFGWVWLRKRHDTAPLHRFEYLTQPVHQPVGQAWAASVRNYDAVHNQPTDGWALTDVHLVAPSWVTYEQYQRFGAEHPEVLMARSGTGFGRHVRLDTATAAVLGAADGELTAGQIVAAVAGLLDLNTEQTDALKDNITELYVDGFVEVFEPDETTG